MLVGSEGWNHYETNGVCQTAGKYDGWLDANIQRDALSNGTYDSNPHGS